MDEHTRQTMHRIAALQAVAIRQSRPYVDIIRNCGYTARPIVTVQNGEIVDYDENLSPEAEKLAAKYREMIDHIHARVLRKLSVDGEVSLPPMSDAPSFSEALQWAESLGLTILRRKASEQNGTHPAVATPATPK